MPTPNLSTAFAVRGQGFNLSGVLRSATTGNPINTGLAGLWASVSKDDGPFVQTTNLPVERNATGWVSLDLTPAEMSAAKVDVMFIATGAVTDCRLIATLDLSPQTQRYDAFAVRRLEQMFLDMHDFLWNAQFDAGALQQVTNTNGVVKGSAAIVEGQDTGYASVRNKLQ